MKIFLDGIIFSKQLDGGISRIFRETVPRVASLDPSVHFIVYLRRKLKAVSLPASDGVRLLYERSIYPWRWASGKARVQATWLQREWRRSQTDIFHTTYFTRPDELRAPYVVSVYDMMDEIYAPIIRRASQWDLVDRKRTCLTAADLILSISHTTTRDILRYCPVDEKKIVTIHLGVSPRFHAVGEDSRKAAFRRTHRLERPYFLYLGNRRFIKNFMQLLRAYADSRTRREVDLVAVGGEREFTTEERAFIAAKGLESTVTHLGNMSDEELCLAYNCASAFVYPSLYEGFGLPLLEAMACGTPVVASKTGAIPEVAGDAALYFNPQDLDDIRSSLETVMQPGTAATLTEKGTARARLFTWEQTARQTLEAYRQLV
jgi:glycosyltransferase involved in cell wall biosynthesis